MAAKKKSFISRLLKFVMILVGLIVLLVAGLIIFLNPIIEKTINVGGPMMLGVPVKVEKVSVKPTGTIDLKNLYIGNPENYSTNMALFAVDRVHVNLDMKSLLSDVITIRKIQVDQSQISYEVKNGKSNFDVLKERLSEIEKKKKDKKDKPSSEKRVVIDLLALNKAKVSYTHSVFTAGGTVTLPIPSMEIKDIGKNPDGGEGVTSEEAALEVLGNMGNVIGSSGKALGATIKTVGEGAKAVGEGAKEAVKAVGDEAKKALDAAKGLFK